MTVTQVAGCGAQKGLLSEYYRGVQMENRELLP